jgi:hypothetical protein
LRLCAAPGSVGRTAYKPATAAIATGATGGCTVIAARGYGTGVGQYAVAMAGEVHGFPAVVTSFIGRAEDVREIADLLERTGW